MSKVPFPFFPDLTLHFPTKMVNPIPLYIFAPALTMPGKESGLSGINTGNKAGGEKFVDHYICFIIVG